MKIKTCVKAGLNGKTDGPRGNDPYSMQSCGRYGRGKDGVCKTKLGQNT